MQAGWQADVAAFKCWQLRQLRMKLSLRHNFANPKELLGLASKIPPSCERCSKELPIESSHLANTRGVRLHIVWTRMNCCSNLFAFLCDCLCDCKAAIHERKL